MNTSDPQFLYMILVLPSLFGLTLMGEGIYKCVHEEWSGLISVFFGFWFGVVIEILKINRRKFAVLPFRMSHGEKLQPVNRRTDKYTTGWSVQDLCLDHTSK